MEALSDEGRYEKKRDTLLLTHTHTHKRVYTNREAFKELSSKLEKEGEKLQNAAFAAVKVAQQGGGESAHDFLDAFTSFHQFETEGIAELLVRYCPLAPARTVLEAVALSLHKELPSFEPMDIIQAAISQPGFPGTLRPPTPAVRLLCL